MARDHGRLLVTIWRDGDFTSLPAAAQRIYMLILSQPRLSYCGAIDYTPQRWATLAGDTSVSDIEKAVKHLEAARVIVVDRETSEVLVRTFVRHDGVCESPNLVQAMWKAWGALFSQTLRAAVVAELPEVAFTSGFGSERPKVGYEPPSEAVEMRNEPSSNPSGNPSPTPYPSPSPTPTPAPLEGAAAQPPATRAARIPDSFFITAEMRDWAANEVPNVDIAAEIRKFVDHFRAMSGSKATKLDWVATWRNWMRRSPEFTRTTRQSKSDAAVTNLQEWLDKGAPTPFAIGSGEGA